MKEKRKVAAIFDEPKACGYCPLIIYAVGELEEYARCKLCQDSKGNGELRLLSYFTEKKPDWCPLTILNVLPKTN